jgi:hypothetical protein
MGGNCRPDGAALQIRASHIGNMAYHQAFATIYVVGFTDLLN